MIWKITLCTVKKIVFNFHILSIVTYKTIVMILEYIKLSIDCQAESFTVSLYQLVFNKG